MKGGPHLAGNGQTVVDGEIPARLRRRQTADEVQEVEARSRVWLASTGASQNGGETRTERLPTAARSSGGRSRRPTARNKVREALLDALG